MLPNQRGRGGKGDGGRGGRGRGRGPYTPSTEAVHALKEIFGSLESLNVQDRGHVLSRIRSYVAPASTKKAIAPKEVKPKPQMSDWKSEWQVTDEFINWDAIFKLRGAHAKFAKTGKPEDEPDVALPEEAGDLEMSLRVIAFAKRDEIKGRSKSIDKGTSGEDGAPPPPDKDQAVKQKPAKPTGTSQSRKRQDAPWNAETILAAIESVKKPKPAKSLLYAWMIDDGDSLVYHTEQPPEGSHVADPHMYYEQIEADSEGNYFTLDGDSISSCMTDTSEESPPIIVVVERPE